VAIDPYRSLSAEKCHRHIAPMPGTDGALALALIHVLIRDDLLDHDYIERHTVGFEALRERAQAYTPARAAEICGIPAEDIEWLAGLYGQLAVRERQPVAIRLNYGMQRVHGGGQAVRAVACLPSLVGAWRQPAGGLQLSTSGFFPIDEAALQRPDLLPGWPQTLPRIVNMSTIGDALLAEPAPGAPRIEAVVVYNSNPVAVAPESGKVAAGFAREDLFTVVLEHFRTDTADYADILLPATTQLEHTDVHKAYGHTYFLANNAAIAPMGEALPNTEIFRRLAQRLGFTEACFADSDEAIAAQAIIPGDARAAGISWESLKAQGWQKLALPAAPFAEGGFPTASGKCQFYSEPMARDGFDPLSAGDDLAAGAQLPQQLLRQRRQPARHRGRAAPGHPPGRRRRARHRARRHGARLQRPRQHGGARPRHRPRPARAGGGPVDLVEEAGFGRQERQRADQPAPDRPGPRAGVL